jgi:hypothetical protein
VWLLISKVLNAAIVTSVIAQTSLCVSFLITIFEFIVSHPSFLQANAWAQAQRRVSADIACNPLLGDL